MTKTVSKRGATARSKKTKTNQHNRPHTAMPVTGISEAARDIAAYLYQLR